MANHVRNAAEAMASLYVWDTVVSILEGAARPQIGDRDAEKVIKIAKKNQQKCLREYDRLAEKIQEYNHD